MTGETAARAEMRALHRAPETQVLGALLPAARLDSASRDRINARALGLIADLRAAQGSGWVNRFLQQYRLNTQEGIALLSLAEAFLRVPDADTADLLIRDKIGGADWGAHTGQSDSLLVCIKCCKTATQPHYFSPPHATRLTRRCWPNFGKNTATPLHTYCTAALIPRLPPNWPLRAR